MGSLKIIKNSSFLYYLDCHLRTKLQLELHQVPDNPCQAPDDDIICIWQNFIVKTRPSRITAMKLFCILNNFKQLDYGDLPFQDNSWWHYFASEESWL